MGWLSKLFGHERPQSAPELPLGEVQASALLGLLVPQLELLELQLEKVPVGGSFTSTRSRGYIYGLAAGVLGTTTKHQDGAMAEDIMHAPFTLVWGRNNAQNPFDQTLAESAARHGETLAGAYRAESDVGDVCSGKPFATVMGFWLLNNGLNDSEAIMSVFENPRPVPATG
jgi:hypothetical protein